MSRKKEDLMCKACLFYDGCPDRVARGCFTPIDDRDREVEQLIETNRISYRGEYFRYLEYAAD